jgi:hypothetical protein
MRKIILIISIVFAGVTFLAASYYGAENHYGIATTEANND